MAKSTKVTDLAATLNMDGQQLVEQINSLNLGFAVKTKSSGLTEEQITKVKQALSAQRLERSNSAIDAKSQSTATKTTVRVRRRKVEETPAVVAPSDAASAVRPEQPAEERRAVVSEQSEVSKVEPVPADEKEAVKHGDSKVMAKNAEGAVADSAEDVRAHTEHTECIAKSENAVETAVQPVADQSIPSKEPTVEIASASSEGTAATEGSAVQPPSVSKMTEKEKKAAKKAEKDKRKNEKYIELGSPNFGKPVEISIGNSFADQVPEEYASEVEEIEEDDLRKQHKSGKPSRKPSNLVEDAELDLDGDDDEQEMAKSSHKKSSRPSNITGAIDPAVIRAMLLKDNKKFGNGEKGNKKSSARTVVNSSQFYGGQAPAPKNTNSSGTSFKKVKRNNNKMTPAERAAAHPQAAEHKRVVKVAENITVGNLANEMNVKASEVIRFLMKELGMMVTVNQTVDVATAELVAAEYGFTVQDVSFNEEAFTASTVDAPEQLELRAPIVTVMGHVDHGKTSLLDAIRNSRVTATEAGGITQHIGASTIDTPNGKVVFLDTPGHEAFTALRARGAKVTDLVVLVVAADDGVMPQTVEAINHAKAAGVPIIVAINKIDKPGANPDRVKQALTEYELIPEEWGGTTLFKEVSAKTGEGVEDLLELIQLQSEVLELKANPDKPAHGFILEAYKDNRRGTVASILVQEGTLHINDILVSGACYGKVKSMTNDRGKNIKLAEPSTPVEITGLSDVPDAGEPFFVAKDEKIAKEFTTQIKERKRNAELSSRKFDPWAQFKDNKTLNLIIKADVQGSLEALNKSLSSLSTEDVELNIVHAAVGGATENDVSLAIASNAIIVGFNTRPDARAAEIAKREGVIIESFSIIYDIIDYVKDAMSGLLDPIIGENVLGHAEIRNTFNVPKVGTIAGGYVTDGIVRRGAKCRLLRNGKIIYDSKIASLKRFKDDAKEVRSGFECGFSIENYNDVKVGDVVEIYEVTETKQSL